MVLLVADAKIAIATRFGTMKRGKSRRKGRTTRNSKDSRVFFRERIPCPREQSGKQREGGGDETVKSRKRKARTPEVRSRGKRTGESEGRRARRVYRLPSPRYQKYRPNLILLSDYKQILPAKLSRAFVASRNP